jgi:hypothetical protein
MSSVEAAEDSNNGRGCRARMWILGVGGGLGFVLLAGFVLLVFVTTLGRPRLTDSEAFVATVWRSETGHTGRATGSGPSARSRMVEDLVATHLRPGTSRETVLALLGSPPSGASNDSEWCYPAGWEQWPLGFGRHAIWLRIGFDAEDRIERAWIMAKPE